MSGFRGSTPQLWISTVLRLGLAGVLLWSGGAKVSEPRQAVMAVQAYEILPTSVGEFVGYALPLFELALGLALLLGVATRISAVISGALDDGLRGGRGHSVGTRAVDRLRVLWWWRRRGRG